MIVTKIDDQKDNLFIIQLGEVCVKSISNVGEIDIL